MAKPPKLEVCFQGAQSITLQRIGRLHVPKVENDEWSSCNLLIMVYILRPLLWLHSISMD